MRLSLTIAVAAVLLCARPAQATREYDAAMKYILDCVTSQVSSQADQCLHSAKMLDQIDIVLDIKRSTDEIKMIPAKQANARRNGFLPVEAGDVIDHPDDYFGKNIELTNVQCVYHGAQDFMCYKRGVGVTLKVIHPEETQKKIIQNCTKADKKLYPKCSFDIRFSYGSFSYIPKTQEEMQEQTNELAQYNENIRFFFKALQVRLETTDARNLTPLEQQIRRQRDDEVIRLAHQRIKYTIDKLPRWPSEFIALDADEVTLLPFNRK